MCAALTTAAAFVSRPALDEFAEVLANTGHLVVFSAIAFVEARLFARAGPRIAYDATDNLRMRPKAGWVDDVVTCVDEWRQTRRRLLDNPAAPLDDPGEMLNYCSMFEHPLFTEAAGELELVGRASEAAKIRKLLASASAAASPPKQQHQGVSTDELRSVISRAARLNSADQYAEACQLLLTTRNAAGDWEQLEYGPQMLLVQGDMMLISVLSSMHRFDESISFGSVALTRLMALKFEQSHELFHRTLFALADSYHHALKHAPIGSKERRRIFGAGSRLARRCQRIRRLIGAPQRMQDGIDWIVDTFKSDFVSGTTCWLRDKAGTEAAKRCAVVKCRKMCDNVECAKLEKDGERFRLCAGLICFCIFFVHISSLTL